MTARRKKAKAVEETVEDEPLEARIARKEAEYRAQKKKEDGRTGDRLILKEDPNIGEFFRVDVKEMIRQRRKL